MEENVEELILSKKKETLSLVEQINQQKKLVDDAKMEDFVASSEIETQPRVIKAKKTLRGHTAKVYSCAWSDDGQKLVSASHDGKVIVWDPINAKKIHSYTLKCNWVMACAVSPSGDLIACGGLDNICSIYSSAKSDLIDGKANKPMRELYAHNGYISAAQFITEKQVLTASGDSSCILWDVERSKILEKFQDHAGDVMSISVSPGRDVFISGSCDTTAKLWDIRTGKVQKTFLGHTEDINAVRLLPDGNCFGTASDDSTCRLFDIRGIKELAIYSDSSITEGVTSLSFSKTGKYFFAAYEDNTVIQWSTLKMTPLSYLEEHEKRVSCVNVSPIGNCLATSSWDSTLKIWA